MFTIHEQDGIEVDVPVGDVRVVTTAHGPDGALLTAVVTDTHTWFDRRPQPDVREAYRAAARGAHGHLWRRRAG